MAAICFIKSRGTARNGHFLKISPTVVLGERDGSSRPPGAHKEEGWGERCSPHPEKAVIPPPGESRLAAQVSPGEAR